MPDRLRSIPDKVWGLGSGEWKELEHPIPVRAWVEMIDGTWKQIDGDMAAHSKKAGRSRLVDQAGNLASAWIWASQVIERR